MHWRSADQVHVCGQEAWGGPTPPHGVQVGPALHPGAPLLGHVPGREASRAARTAQSGLTPPVTHTRHRNCWQVRVSPCLTETMAGDAVDSLTMSHGDNGW